MGLDKKKNNIVSLELDDFKEIIYWIVLKYKEDDFHQQQASSRRDLIGGFFDRWLNKIPESLIFNKLLDKRPYSVITDYFLYGQNTNKDAPDILGLKDDDGNIFKFVTFNDGEWILEKDAPHIEMKVFRETQYMITVPETQWDDENFYAIVESHIRSDYLITLFSKDFFNEDIFNSIKTKMLEEFISSGSDKIKKPDKLVDDSFLGQYELLGIYTGKELKKYSSLLEKGIKPMYFVDVSEPPKIKKSEIIEEPLFLKNGFNYYIDKNSYEQDENNIKFYLELIDDSRVRVKKIINTAMDIEVEGKIKINGEEFDSGFYRMNFKQFSRTGNRSEYISSKGTVAYCAKDSMEELINIFDEIVKE